MDTTKDIITPESPRWVEFFFAFDASMATGPFDNSYRRTRKILESMGNVDIEGTLKYFRSQGGYDDVEVMMNVVCVAPFPRLTSLISERPPHGHEAAV